MRASLTAVIFTKASRRLLSVSPPVLRSNLALASGDTGHQHGLALQRRRRSLEKARPRRRLTGHQHGLALATKGVAKHGSRPSHGGQVDDAAPGGAAGPASAAR